MHFQESVVSEKDYFMLTVRSCSSRKNLLLLVGFAEFSRVEIRKKNRSGFFVYQCFHRVLDKVDAVEARP